MTYGICYWFFLLLFPPDDASRGAALLANASFDLCLALSSHLKNSQLLYYR